MVDRSKSTLAGRGATTADRIPKTVAILKGKVLGYDTVTDQALAY